MDFQNHEREKKQNFLVDKMSNGLDMFKFNQFLKEKKGANFDLEDCNFEQL